MISVDRVPGNRIFYEAARHDRPMRWTCDDLEAGRLQSNELSRPNGHLEPNPDERWEGRVPIQEEERAAFQAAVQKREADAFKRLGFLPGIELSRRDRHAVWRLALALALVDQGFLQVRRRRFTPPFRSVSVSFFSRGYKPHVAPRASAPGHRRPARRLRGRAHFLGGGGVMERTTRAGWAKKYQGVKSFMPSEDSPSTLPSDSRKPRG
jgi:hypothetical protein